MAISVRLNTRDEKLFKKYAKSNNITVSELIRKSVLEKIEDEFDLKVYKKCIEEYENNPISYSHNEVCEMLGIEE